MSFRLPCVCLCVSNIYIRVSFFFLMCVGLFLLFFSVPGKFFDTQNRSRVQRVKFIRDELERIRRRMPSMCACVSRVSFSRSMHVSAFERNLPTKEDIHCVQGIAILSFSLVPNCLSIVAQCFFIVRFAFLCRIGFFSFFSVFSTPAARLSSSAAPQICLAEQSRRCV